MNDLLFQFRQPAASRRNNRIGPCIALVQINDRLIHRRGSVRILLGQRFGDRQPFDQVRQLLLALPRPNRTAECRFVVGQVELRRLYELSVANCILFEIVVSCGRCIGPGHPLRKNSPTIRASPSPCLATSRHDRSPANTVARPATGFRRLSADAASLPLQLAIQFIQLDSFLESLDHGGMRIVRICGSEIRRLHSRRGSAMRRHQRRFLP